MNQTEWLHVLTLWKGLMSEMCSTFMYVGFIYVWTDFADLTFISIPFLDAYIYYVGTHHGNLLESLVTVSR